MGATPPRPRHWIGGYGVAFIAVGCAAGYAAVVNGATAITPFILFVVAVAVTTARGGFWPGACAIALAALVSDFLFLDPRHELTLGCGTAYLTATYSVGFVGYLVASRTRKASQSCHRPELHGTVGREFTSVRRATSGRG